MIKVKWEKNKKTTSPEAKVKRWRWISLIAIIIFAILCITIATLYFCKVQAAQSYEEARPLLIAFVSVQAVSIFAIIVFFIIFQVICIDYFDGKDEKSKKSK